MYYTAYDIVDNNSAIKYVLYTVSKVDRRVCKYKYIEIDNIKYTYSTQYGTLCYTALLLARYKMSTFSIKRR